MSKSRQLSDAINSVDISESAPADAVTLDASGNLLVGKTAVGDNTAGFDARSSGRTAIVASGTAPLTLNRQTSDGSVIDLLKDGSTVGSIGVVASDLTIGTGDTGLRFVDSTDTLYPWNTSTNSSRDATIDIGIASHRFKDLYLSGGVYLGGTGSANKLEDYEEGTWSPTVVTGTNGSTSGGQYVKVGSLVYITGEIDNLSDTSSSNSITVGGLPFTSRNHPNFNGGVYGERIDAAFQHAKTRVKNNNTQLDFINGIGVTDFADFIKHSNVNNGTDMALRFSAMYFTDS